MHKGAIIAALTGALFVHAAQAADSVPGNMPEPSSAGMRTVPAGLPGIESLGQVSREELLVSGKGLIMVPPANLNVAGYLLTANMYIWSFAGWEAGRLLNARQGLPDPGPYPGLHAILSGGR